MNTKTNFKIIIFSIIILAGSCKKKSTHEQETITTVKLTLNNGGKTTIAQWKDADGAGGNNPIIDTMILDTNIIYTGTIEVFDETKNPIANLTEEIDKESDVHQFFYTSLGSISSSFTIDKTDQDKNGLPIGLAYKLTTKQQKGNGSLRIVLSHYDGVTKTTSPSNESDIDIEIPVLIK